MSSIPLGELPPPPPKVFFGRDELVQKIVSSAENLASMALIGTGGIGKTSVVLTVLDDHRVKKRFGDNRSFIRCDRLTPSHTHLLRKLSEAIGAGVENPEDLSPLRRCLSSKELIIVLDNAESILGLAETTAQEIHAIVDELSHFSNICLIITSRISNALPTHCEVIEVPTLSMEAGRGTFHRIYRVGERSNEINDILKELDFHALSVTLLATVAQQNRWDTKRLIAEWEKQRTGVLRARNLRSLATTVELSLSSPMFQELGPDAREVLGVVAFFPQGVDEGQVERLFPAISDGPSLFDTFCNLSLTYRSNGFTTMLAPLRDYLRPKDPMASPLLHTAKEHYFGRLSCRFTSLQSAIDGSQWIVSEDVNVEYLLDVFTSIDADSGDVWKACINFMRFLIMHKPRYVILGPKFEALPDSHSDKPDCLTRLSWLFNGMGSWVEAKRLRIQTLGLWRERGNDREVADTLIGLSDANRYIGLSKEGIQQAREALDICGRLDETGMQVDGLITLAESLHADGQLDAAEEAASRALHLSENPNPGKPCQCHRVLGEIHQSKGNREKAIHHFEASLRIASTLNLSRQVSMVHLTLAKLYSGEGKYSDALTHVEHAKSHAGDSTLILGEILLMGAVLLYQYNRLEEAKSETLRALDVYGKTGPAHLVEKSGQMLKEIEKKLDDSGKRLKWCSSSLLLILLSQTQTRAPNDSDSDRLSFFDIPFPDVDMRKLSRTPLQGPHIPATPLDVPFACRVWISLFPVLAASSSHRHKNIPTHHASFYSVFNLYTMLFSCVLCYTSRSVTVGSLFTGDHSVWDTPHTH